jgi:hypothetical protein
VAAVNDDPASLDGAKPGTRAIVRVLAFAAVAAMTSFVVGWLVGDGSFRHWLFSCAGSLEFWGVLLVASPELVPYLRPLAGDSVRCGIGPRRSPVGRPTGCG